MAGFEVMNVVPVQALTAEHQIATDIQQVVKTLVDFGGLLIWVASKVDDRQRDQSLVLS